MRARIGMTAALYRDTDGSQYSGFSEVEGTRKDSAQSYSSTMDKPDQEPPKRDTWLGLILNDANESSAEQIEHVEQDQVSEISNNSMTVFPDVRSLASDPKMAAHCQAKDEPNEFTMMHSEQEYHVQQHDDIAEVPRFWSEIVNPANNYEQAPSNQGHAGPRPKLGKSPAKRKTCTIADCNKDAFRRGICTQHYYRCKEPNCIKTGSYSRYCRAHALQRGLMEVCTRENCSRPAYCKGLCSGHYRECKVSGCEHNGNYGGYCFMHGKQEECIMEGCTSRAKRNKLCWRHSSKVFCDHPGCTKNRHVGKFCFAHSTTTCFVEGCTNKGELRGGCRKHRHIPPPDSSAAPLHKQKDP